MSPTEVSSSVNSLNLNTYSGGSMKTSSNIDFSSKLKRGMAQGASLTYQSVAPMAPYVPGGVVMSAMLGNTAHTLASEGIAPAGTGGTYGANMMPGVMPAGAPAAGVSGGNMFESMEHLQQNMMSMNVYMLGLQQGFNEMNQKYTAISNILKTKHDTEKNAIQNFR